jgi:hypothetical protein
MYILASCVLLLYRHAMFHAPPLRTRWCCLACLWTYNILEFIEGCMGYKANACRACAVLHGGCPLFNWFLLALMLLGCSHASPEDTIATELSERFVLI